ncbi:hypothetical protein G7046_g1604 [Stylonectria norvegica]|nr:hypothetical protein G7046_g1604 [Stylonectria norvegica]
MSATARSAYINNSAGRAGKQKEAAGVICFKSVTAVRLGRCLEAGCNIRIEHLMFGVTGDGPACDVSLRTPWDQQQTRRDVKIAPPPTTISITALAVRILLSEFSV